MKLHPFVVSVCVSWIGFSPMGCLPAQEAGVEPAAPVVEPAPAVTGTAPAPKEELEQLEARLKELGRTAEADPSVVPLKAAFTEADQKLKAAFAEAAKRLDPEGRLEALRTEEKTANPERKKAIQSERKVLEQTVHADPAVAPLRASREEAQKAMQKAKEAVLVALAPDYKNMEKRRGELKAALRNASMP